MTLRLHTLAGSVPLMATSLSSMSRNSPRTADDDDGTVPSSETPATTMTTWTVTLGPTQTSLVEKGDEEAGEQVYIIGVFIRIYSALPFTLAERGKITRGTRRTR